MDEQVGRRVAAIDRLPQDRETIILFTSDNCGERFSDVWPFSGCKTELLEGGIRVPTIIRWPRAYEGGGEDRTPHMTMDLTATLIAAAGARFPAERRPDERANLKDRDPERFAALQGAWEAWNSGMLPYRDHSFTHGFHGDELADHFGVE